MIWRHHPVRQLDIRLRGAFHPVPHWDQFGAPRHLQSNPGRGGWQPGKARRGCGSQASTARRRQRRVQWPLLLLRDIVETFGMDSAQRGRAAPREVPASPKETILILTNSFLVPCSKKSASSQPLPCYKLGPEHWQSHSLLLSQDFSMLLAE